MNTQLNHLEKALEPPENCHFIHHLTCYNHWLYSHKLLPLGVVKYGMNKRINE